VTFQDKYPSSIYDGRQIEVQIRTWLQHSWATAVEAVGLFLGQDLKAGRGDPQWLRFFKLMAAEFAAAEGCALPADVPDRPGRLAQIKTLDQALNAAQTLEDLSRR
jgi:hypothetical protein